VQVTRDHAAIGGRVEGQAATVRLGDRLDDREAETSSGGRATAQALEGLRQPREIRGRDDRARVGHVQLSVPDGHRHAARGVAVAKRVVDEVGRGAPEQHGVAPNDCRVQRRSDPRARGQRGPHDLAQLDGLVLAHAVGDGGQREQRRHQAIGLIGGASTFPETACSATGAARVRWRCARTSTYEAPSRRLPAAASNPAWNSVSRRRTWFTCSTRRRARSRDAGLADLAAQLHHRHADDVGERVDVRVPDRREQRLGRDDVAAGRHERVQDAELLAREGDLRAVAGHDAAGRIAPDVALGQHGRPRGTGPPGERVHAGDEFGQAERLPHGVISADPFGPVPLDA
jgi:hypothetical protein